MQICPASIAQTAKQVTLKFALQNYKETCKQIAYDCDLDTLTAYCGNNKPNVDEAHAFNYSSLSQASDCDGEIMNVWGVLKCQDIPDSDSSDSASGCDSIFSYNSKIDSSGIEAPDGVSHLSLTLFVVHSYQMCSRKELASVLML